jgi:hypothetical protein
MLSSPAAAVPHAYVSTMTPPRKRSQPPMYHIPLSAGMSCVLKRNRPAGADACMTTRHLSLLSVPAQTTAVDAHVSTVRPCSLVDTTMSAGERRHIDVRSRTYRVLHIYCPLRASSPLARVQISRVKLKSYLGSKGLIL